jgi:DNA polymerase-3 subunit epsilon
MFSGLAITDCDFVAVDLETTGCTPGRNSVIEIGAVRLSPHGSTTESSWLVRPQDAVPRAIVQLTGITPEMLSGAPWIDEAIHAFRSFAQGAVLVAHNYRFDLGFLDHEAERLWGEPFPRPAIDTLAIARRLYPGLERYSLLHLAMHFRLGTLPDHRALNDARAAAQLLASMLPDLTAVGIRSVGDLADYCGLGAQTALASRLPLTSGLPDAPGVYTFRDADGRTLFVGRAKSLRSRIRGHFYPAGDRDHSDLGCRVASMRAIPTESILDAALLERRLIARDDPPFNAVSQRPRALYSIHVQTDRVYPGVKVTTGAPLKRGTSIGPFTSRWAATVLADRLAEVHGLRRCARRLTPALAERECDWRDAGCPAPCVSDVDPTAYAARVRALLNALGPGVDEARELLVSMQSQAAQEARYEDAIRYRDGVRALERGIGTLEAIRATAERDVVLIELHDRGVTVHLVQSGLRFAVLRGNPESVGRRLEHALRRAYYSDLPRRDPLSLSPEEVAQMLVIATFMAGDAHMEIPVGDERLTLARIRRVLGLERRQPRRRHAAL